MVDKGVLKTNKLIVDWLVTNFPKKYKISKTMRYTYLMKLMDVGVDTEMWSVFGNGWLGGDLPNFYFHSSWDWLMEVVDMIELNFYKYEFQIGTDRCTIFDRDKIQNPPEDCGIIVNEMFVGKKIKAVYSAVVKFIELYNKFGS